MAVLTPSPAAPPPASLRTVRATDQWLYGLMALYALVYLLFFPRMYTSLDEAANFGMAYVLRHGTIFPAQVGYTLPMSPLGPHGPIYRFPIGFPAILTLASFTGQWALFLVNPLLHLVATWLFAKILRSAGIPTGFAALYLLYPGFALYERTLFSDPFAASMVTIALYCLSRPRGAAWAGVCLGVAMMARSTGLVITAVFAVALFAADWSAYGVRLWRGRLVWFALGLLPFLAANAAYNFATLGNPLASTYSGGVLTVSNFIHLGPLYAASLLLLFPGMLFAPFFYRGRFWRECLAATTLVFLIAGSYYETTYGNSRWETLLTVCRQVLPVMPLYLLAYCGVLSKMWDLGGSRWASRFSKPVIGAAVAALVSVFLGISVFHQRYLQALIEVRREIQATVPKGSIIYGNKDVVKLLQPVWDKTTCRELLQISGQQTIQDLRTAPVYVVLYLRHRGVAHEDGWNSRIVADLQRRYVLAAGPAAPGGRLDYFRVQRLRTEVAQGEAP